jgi:hypothetical protein
LGQELSTATQLTRTLSDSVLSDNDSSPTIESRTPSADTSLPDSANNNNNDDDGNDNIDDDDYLNGDVLQHLHNQEFNRQAEPEATPADAKRRRHPRQTSSDGARVISRSNKRKIHKVSDSDEAEQSSNGTDGSDDDACYPPPAENWRTVTLPQRPKRANLRGGKVKASEEPWEEWEEHDSLKLLRMPGKDR